MKPGFVVIALGGAGANYLKTLADDHEHIASRILIDTESPYPDLDDPLRDDAVVRFLRLRPLQDIPFERQAHALLDAIEPMLRALIAESEMIVVCAGLGGVVGTWMAPALVAWLRKEFRNTPLVCNLTVPFAHEGGKRQELALHAASAIMQSGASTFCVSNQAFGDHFQGMKTLLEMFQVINAAWTGHAIEFHRLIRQRYLARHKSFS